MKKYISVVIIILIVGILSLYAYTTKNDSVSSQMIPDSETRKLLIPGLSWTATTTDNANNSVYIQPSPIRLKGTAWAAIDPLGEKNYSEWTKSLSSAGWQDGSYADEKNNIIMSMADAPTAHEYGFWKKENGTISFLLVSQRLISPPLDDIGFPRCPCATEYVMFVSDPIDFNKLLNHQIN